MSVLTTSAPADSGLVTAPKVNLLPPEIFAARELRTLQVRCAAALGGAVVVAGVWAFVAIHGVGTANSELEEAQRQQATTQSQVRSYANVAATREKVDQADEITATARDGEVRWSQSLAHISQDVPNGVALTRVSAAPPDTAAGDGGSGVSSDTIAVITVTGNAKQHTDVAQWLDNVAKQEGWAKPYFSESKNTEIDDQLVRQFTSTVQVTRESLRNATARNGASS